MEPGEENTGIEAANGDTCFPAGDVGHAGMWLTFVGLESLCRELGGQEQWETRWAWCGHRWPKPHLYS